MTSRRRAAGPCVRASRRHAELRAMAGGEGPPSSVEQRGPSRGAGRRPGSEAATVVRSEHAQRGWNRGENDDAGLMGEERERERGRAAGYLSGQNGDRDQKQE